MLVHTNIFLMIFKTVDNKPKNKFTIGKLLSILFIVNQLIILGMVVVAYLPQYYRTRDVILQTTFGFNIFTIVILLLSAINYMFFRSKSKKYVGNLEFKENEIILNATNYQLSEIKHLRFKGNDIRGEFRGFFSKGFDNQLFITRKNGEEISAYFEQTTEENLKNAEELLKKYHQNGILSEANLESIMTNSNYY